MGFIRVKRGGKAITLADRDGTSEFCIKDADGANIFCVDSAGNVKTKGRIQRL